MKKQQKGLPWRPLLRTQGVIEYVDKSEVSMTVPEQVNSLELILRQRAQGIEVPQFSGVYLGDDKKPIELYKLDAIETMEFRQNLQDQIQELEKDFHSSTRHLAEIQQEQTRRSSATQEQEDFPQEIKPQGAADKTKP